MELVERVEELAAAKGCAAAQIALAWVLAQGEDIVPIPGTTRVKNLEENVGALDIELTNEELRDLEAVFPKGAAAGERYADMSTVDS
jgi:aryl-alcohol dehydrogenase-like predicted oxidoreductase